eukprot:COSAG03_NODE_2405_length_2806_cov_5.727004_5_plen_49_part_00
MFEAKLHQQPLLRAGKSSPHAELQRLLVVLEDPSPPLCPPSAAPVRRA